jgi:hypothetical protein
MRRQKAIGTVFIVVLVIVIAIGTIAFVTLTSQSSTSTSISSSSAISSDPLLTSTSYSTASVQVTGTVTINSTNGCPVGVDAAIPVASNEGLNLTVYLSSRSLEIGQSEGMTAGVQDDTAVPLNANESGFLSLSFLVTNSSGYRVYSSGGCIPVLPPSYNGTSIPSPQGFQCSTVWQTGSPVNGAALRPGTYQIAITGTAGGPDNTIDSVAAIVEVTLS